MMCSKLFLLFAVVFVSVICLASAGDKVTEADGKKSTKKTTFDEKKKDAYEKVKYDREDYDDEIDDSYSPRSSFAHNRFVSHDQPEGNYRTRSRWSPSTTSGLSHSLPTLPFTIGEFPEEDEWSSDGYESAFPSAPSVSPAYSYNMQRMPQNSPTCSSLIDPQFPIFSDTCGAVPQARYSLPNVFGHRDKWQIAQLLNVLASTTTDPTCSRSTRLLLCPILFPSCPTRHQPTPVLPCQSFCRAIKSRCASPLLESLPCEILPHTSELCPSTQGYSQFPSQRAYSHNMPSPLPVASGLPSPLQLSALQSFLSSPALQTAMTTQGFPNGLNQQTLQAALAAQAFPGLFQAQPAQAVPVQAPTVAPVPITTPPPPPPAPVTPPMSVYHNMQFPTDTISAMLGELPPRTLGSDYRPAPRYGSGSRSSHDLRMPSSARSSSMLKA
ncbi:unnamed protein product [Adineta ricciae]|uniref:FZ domain-containing protein n=1 Tax=Adineta ricciae TaxID=249248 RepID=A0A815F971_ADIRI|nr:unnamed protein product [Adineta ricciae]CAF1322106.1 unnamed protein product [Adineta ricciae]